MEQILQYKDLEGCELRWEQLRIKAGVKAVDRTIKRMIENLDQYKCLAYQRSQQLPQSAANQIEYVQKILKKYPRPKDWDRV